MCPFIENENAKSLSITPYSILLQLRDIAAKELVVSTTISFVNLRLFL